MSALPAASRPAPCAWGASPRPSFIATLVHNALGDLRLLAVHPPGVHLRHGDGDTGWSDAVQLLGRPWAVSAPLRWWAVKAAVVATPFPASMRSGAFSGALSYQQVKKVSDRGRHHHLRRSTPVCRLRRGQALRPVLQGGTTTPRTWTTRSRRRRFRPWQARAGAAAAHADQGQRRRWPQGFCVGYDYYHLQAHRTSMPSTWTTRSTT